MNLNRMLLWLVPAFFYCCGAVKADSKPPASTVASGFETVAALPSSGATEGLCEGKDGSFYVTGIDDQILWKITAEGQVTKFADAPAHIMVPLITSSGFIATARKNTASRKSTENGGIYFDFSTDIGTEILIYDKAGKLVDTIAGPQGSYFNGIADTGHGFYVIADTAGPTIWKFNLSTKKIEPWLTNENFSAPPNARSNIAGNGIKTHGNVVYLVVSGRNAIYQISMDSHGNPKGAPTPFVEGIAPDDFDITRDGIFYFPSGTTMIKISPKGEVQKFLEGIPAGPDAMISRDGHWVYWSTRGGNNPQKLLRIRIN